MSWASIASNQTVSLANLQDAVNNGVFTLKNSIPASQECITKSDADYYVYINTSYPSYAAKSSNQLVAKQDLISSPPGPDVYIIAQSGLYPVTGPSSTVTGYVWNNTAADIYLKLVFNSGGQSSGFIAPNVDVLAVYLDTIVSISVSGTITGFGTTLTSSSYITIVANSAPYFYIEKQDGFGSGSTLRIFYSTSVGGTYVPIPQEF
jgi:hypothetical protein